MKKLMYGSMSTLFLILLFANIHPAIAETDNYSSRKIYLGNFKVQKSRPVSGTLSVRWWDLDPFNVAVDDNNNIYVLDIYSKKVLSFAPDGKLIKEIALKNVSFPYTDRNIDDGHMDYLIQVSSDGSLIYVTDGSEEYMWTIFDERGTPIKNKIQIFTLFNRTCKVFSTESALLDINLNQVKQVTKHVYGGEIFDSKFNFYSINAKQKDKKVSLTKMNTDRHEIWKKEISGTKKAIRLLGVDGEDNIYVLTDGPYEIVKVNKDGQSLSRISLPKEPLFTSGNFKNGIFRILCDGTIHYFPPSVKVQEIKNGVGEYAVYKFDKN